MSAAIGSAQSVISARSGTLHYFEGDVSIDGVKMQAKASVFPPIKDQGILRTGRGRAEILLTPGVFLRVGENSAVQMLDTRLASTRVDVLSGNALVESDDPQMSIKDSPVTILYKDYEMRMGKHGLFEINSDPAQLKVFKGDVEVSTTGNHAVVKEDHLMPFSAGLTTEKFDPKAGDELFVWARERSQNLSAANMSSARSISSGNCFVACNSGGMGGWNGGWYYNPYFDMITYVPMAGTFWSPFGFGYFSPLTIGQYYYPGGFSNTGLGSARLGGTAARGGVASGSPVAAGSAYGNGGGLVGGNALGGAPSGGTGLAGGALGSGGSGGRVGGGAPRGR